MKIMKPEEKDFHTVEEMTEKKSMFSKIAGLTIVGAIVIAMVGFGLLDFTTFGSDFVIKVEGKKVTPEKFSKYLDSQRKQYIYRFGPSIIEGFLNKKEFVTMTANSMADQLLIAQSLEDQGIIINKDTVNEYIINHPSFKTPDGKFDRGFFTAYLGQMGITEENYINEQIAILQVKFLTEILSVNELTFMENFAKKTLQEERQKREIFIQRVKIEPQQNAKIEENEILDYYNKNKEQFAIPEAKVVSYGKIDSSSLGNNFVTNEEVKKEYNREYIFKNQKLNFYNLSFNSKQEAEKTEKLIKEGRGIADVAKQTLGLNTSDIYFKDVQFSDLGLEFSEQIIQLSKGQTSPIFYANNAWHIVKLDSFTKASAPSLESVSGKIKEKLNARNSCSAVEALSRKIEAEFDSGENLEGVKSSLTLKEVTIAEGIGNTLPENISKAMLADSDVYYAKVLKAKPCEFYAYQIKEIKPKTYKDVTVVKPEIIKALLLINAKSETSKKAEGLRQKFISGERMIISSRNEGLFTDQQLKQIFNSKEGEVLIPLLAKNEREFIVIKIIKIIPGNEKEISKTEIEKKVKELKELQKERLLQGYLEFLRTKYSVKINYSYIQIPN